MIYIKFEKLHCLMLHAKFQSHRPSVSGFQRFLLFIAMAAILVMWPGPFIQTLVPPS